MSGNPPSAVPYDATPWSCSPVGRDGKWFVLDCAGCWVATVATEQLAMLLVEMSRPPGEVEFLWNAGGGPYPCHHPDCGRPAVDGNVHGLWCDWHDPAKDGHDED